MNQIPEFLDVNQVAEYLKVKPVTVYKWMSNARKNKTESIPFIKVHGRLLFRTSDVLYWVIKQKPIAAQ